VVEPLKRPDYADDPKEKDLITSCIVRPKLINAKKKARVNKARFSRCALADRISSGRVASGNYHQILCRFLQNKLYFSKGSTGNNPAENDNL